MKWHAWRRTLGEVLINLTVLQLLFVAWQLWWKDVTANREQASTIQALENTSVRLASQVGP